MNLNDTLREVSKGPCGCSEDEYRWMYQTCIEDLPGGPGVLVEIGSWYGASTVVLGSAAQELNTWLVSIDTFHLGFFPHEDQYNYDAGRDKCDLVRDNARRILNAGIRSHVHTHIADSVEHAKVCPIPDIKFLWIDGYHRYPQALTEWRAYAPQVMPGGIVGIHDAQEPGGAKNCIEELEQDGDFEGWTEIKLPDLKMPLQLNEFDLDHKKQWLIRAWRKDG